MPKAFLQGSPAPPKAKHPSACPPAGTLCQGAGLCCCCCLLSPSPAPRPLPASQRMVIDPVAPRAVPTARCNA